MSLHSSYNVNDSVFLSDSLPTHSGSDDGLSSIPNLKSRSRSGTLSQLPLSSLLSVKLTSSPSSPAVSSLSTTQQSNEETARQKHSRDRNHDESKKLLAHILHELDNRTRPPAVFDLFEQNTTAVIENRLDAIVQNVKDVSSKLRAVPSSRTTSLIDDDSDEDDTKLMSFDTDNTYALMIQLRDVLLIARAHGWHIFDNSPLSEFGVNLQRSRRNSLSSSHRGFSRSPSPDELKGKLQVERSGLLEQCIFILSSIVMEDCRFKTSRPKLTRPPNALQAVTLDVAQFLVVLHHDKPNVLYEISYSMLPAFSTFPIQMHARLLRFFEESILRRMLSSLNLLRQINPNISVDDKPHEEQGNNIENVPSGEAAVTIRIEMSPDNSTKDRHESHFIDLFSDQNQSHKLKSVEAHPSPFQMAYLYSIIPGLLTVIFDHVDLESDDILVRFRVRRLLNLIITSKLDAFVDILEVIAYGTSRAKTPAIRLFASYWPRSLGYNVISKTLHPILLVNNQQPERVGSHKSDLQDEAHTHQFVPWRSSHSNVCDKFCGYSSQDCRLCSRPILEFFLLCPFCMCSVHFDCFDIPESRSLHQYYHPERGTKIVGVRRFSNILVARQFGNLDEGDTLALHHHLFVPINIFTLSLCFICRLPLWGHIAQGVRCTTCNHIAHRSCLIGPAMDIAQCDVGKCDSSFFEITWDNFRTSFLDYYNSILLSEAEATSKGFEELSISFVSLWVQLQLIINGMNSGSVVIARIDNEANRDSKELAVFELQEALNCYNTLLNSDRLVCGFFINAFCKETDSRPSPFSILFDWAVLEYVASMNKTYSSSWSQNPRSRIELLNKTSLEKSDSAVWTDEECKEVVAISFAHMKFGLRCCLALTDKRIVDLVCHHFHHVGLFECSRILRQTDYGENWENSCVFPIPFGIDHSPQVETLIAAVEHCLKDLDLSINEAGLLLLIRKLWPSKAASDHGLFRLISIVMTWILKEDDCLATIIRDFASKGQSLPGVPSGVENQSWPNVTNTRAGSSHNGGDYVACRKALLTLYARPWLKAIHDLNQSSYPKAVYDVCLTFAKENDCVDVFNDPTNLQLDNKDLCSNVTERLLRSMSKSFQSLVVFSGSQDLILLCLRFLIENKHNREHVPAYSRLFSLDSENTRRSTLTDEFTSGISEKTSSSILDLWDILIKNASESHDELKTVLKLLRLFTSSGEDVSIKIIFQLRKIMRDFKVGFEEDNCFLEAIFSAVWIKSLGKQDLQATVADLLSSHVSQTLDNLRNAISRGETHRFTRLCLATCLLLYGCDRGHILGVGIVEEQDVISLISRRKVIRRASMVEDPIIVNARLIETLSVYVNVAPHSVQLLIAQFLSSFINDATLVESYEIDNFILRNSQFLTKCIWCFYGTDIPGMTSLRCSLLPRILAVDASPFESMLSTLFHSSKSWEARLRAARCLFRVIVELPHPLFTVEGRQWKSCVIQIFSYFFDRLWSDDREEIRAAVDVWCKSLQTTHIDIISSCWNEFLGKAPIKDRVTLVSFLLQLRPHFPTWKVLSWDVIMETLLDDDFMQRNGNDETSPASAHLSMYGISFEASRSTVLIQDPDMAQLQSSLLLLTLRMIADGVLIDLFSVLRVKFHLVTLLGFKDAEFVPAPNGQSFYVRYGDLGYINNLAFPCIDGLLNVLDASQDLDLPSSAMTGIEDTYSTRSLMGAIFVDVVIDLFNQLDITGIPHDLDNMPLRHLKDRFRKAIRKVTDVYTLDLSYELRSLSISICQAYIDKWPSQASNVLIYQVQNLLTLLSSKLDDGDDILVAKTTTFLKMTISRYSSSGLIFQLFKRPLEKKIFEILQLIFNANSPTLQASQDLKESVLRDTLSQVLNQPHETKNRHILQNMQAFVEVVHHENFSFELMQFVGRSLTAIIRIASERASDNFDPNPILLTMASLVQYNKLQSRDFLSYIELSLRVALARFDVDAKSFAKLLQVTSTLHRRAAGSQEATSIRTTTTTAAVMTEICSEALRGKTRITPYTLCNALESLMNYSMYNNEFASYITDDETSRLATDGIHYLRHHSLYDGATQKSLDLLLKISSLLFRVSDRDQEFISRQFNDPSADKAPKISFSLKVWNILALNALQSESVSSAFTIIGHFRDFSLDYHVALHMHSQSSNVFQDLLASEINHAYVAIKSWLLLTRKASRVSITDAGFLSKDIESSPLDEEIHAKLIWNDLWPPFEKLMQYGDSDLAVTSPIAISIWTTVADIFLFLRQMRSVIALDFSSQISTLNKIIPASRGDSMSGKLSRAMNSMSEPPPNMSLEALLGQIAEDIIAAEKLHSLEVKNEVGRNLIDRSKRDLRLPS